MHLSQQASRVLGSRTTRARNRAEALRSRGVDVVNFAAGELDLLPPEALRHALYEAARGATNRYTETAGLPELRAALADRISSLSEVNRTPGEVMVTTGAKHGLYLACLALLDPGDEVLIPQPGWGTFTAQVRLAGATPVPVETSGSEFVPLPEQLERARTGRTRMVVVNTPNNPTGVVCPPETLARIAAWAVRHRLWILFDESYGELVLPGAVHAHPVALVPEAREVTVTVGSFSKSFAVTGWRVGHVHGPAPVIEAMKNLQSHTTSSASSVAQYAVLPAARGELDTFVADVRSTLRARHALVGAALREIPQVTAVTPQGAFYYFLDFRTVVGGKLGGVPVAGSEALADVLLEQAHIALTPGKAFGADTCLRLSYAIGTDRIAEGLTALKRVISRAE
ncbi:pyridoxal phosphate-dependent aminotransferase [Streptomyces sp. NPDC021093]|uniref:pyridoxal phosphate-dependent aminotransferase n=1 Tax=Streptomyces sp. NPDC021093 TaxID=3365112 RepID=UPI0037AB6BBA